MQPLVGRHFFFVSRKSAAPKHRGSGSSRGLQESSAGESFSHGWLLDEDAYRGVD
jgi:hypothetical protein